MPRPDFETSQPRDPTKLELVELAVDALLFNSYEDLDIDKQVELIFQLTAAGEKEMAKELFVKNFRLGFLEGVIAQASNPELISEINNSGDED